MGMVPTYDVRSTASRYSSCSTPNKTTHAFRPETNEGVSSQPMNDARVLCLKQTKVTILPKKFPMKIQLRRSHLIQIVDVFLVRNVFPSRHDNSWPVIKVSIKIESHDIVLDCLRRSSRTDSIIHFFTIITAATGGVELNKRIQHTKTGSASLYQTFERSVLIALLPYAMDVASDAGASTVSDLTHLPTYPLARGMPETTYPAVAIKRGGVDGVGLRPSRGGRREKSVAVILRVARAISTCIGATANHRCIQ